MASIDWLVGMFLKKLDNCFVLALFACTLSSLKRKGHNFAEPFCENGRHFSGRQGVIAARLRLQLDDPIMPAWIILNHAKEGHFGAQSVIGATLPSTPQVILFSTI